MRRFGGIALLLAAPAAAQIRDLATTNDGREVIFFAYSRPPGVAAIASSQAALLRYRDGAWSVYESSAGAGTPGVTGDGKIVSWVRSFGCGSCMGLTPRSATEFSGLDTTRIKIPNYNTQVSRNGRYAFFPGSLGVISPAVQDLETGRTWDHPTASVPFSPSLIADDGTVLGLKSQGFNYPFPNYVTPHTIVRWRPDTPVEDLLTSPDPVVRIALAAEGRRAVVQTASKAARQFWLLDVVTRQKRLMAELAVDSRVPESVPARLSVSADGRRAVFFLWFGFPDTPVPVYYWDESAGAGATPLEGIPEGVSGAVISQDGGSAWVATERNRLLRFDLNSGGTSEEILSAFPFFLRHFGHGSPVPGSAVHLTTYGTVDDFQVRLGELEFPVLPSEASKVAVVQLPWELASRLSAPFLQELPIVASKAGYPLELPVELPATNRLLIQFETLLPDAYPRQVKATAAGVVPIDSARPARPGETVRVWFTGLGPLDRPVAAGVPGPADPPARPQTEVACAIMGQDFFNPPWQGVETSPVVYAPGKVGLYQLDLKIPDNWPDGVHNLACYRPGTQDRTDALIPVARGE